MFKKVRKNIYSRLSLSILKLVHMHVYWNEHISEMNEPNVIILIDSESGKIAQQNLTLNITENNLLKSNKKGQVFY